MKGLQNSILATLAYYDAMNFPLTLFELKKYLIHPARLGYVKLKEFGFEGILRELKLLGQKEIVSSRNGFYFLSPHPHLADERIERQKIAERKWKLTQKAIRFVNLVPWVLAVFGSGSLALNNTNPKSDLDVLVVVKNGRIWTARVFISLLMSILGVRRTKFHNIAPDKVCLNHYVTDESLYIPHQSLYNAHTYAHLVPIFLRDESIIYAFKKENSWIRKYLYNWIEEGEQHLRTLKPYPRMRKIAVFLEKALGGNAGNVLERFFKKVQLARIKKDPAARGSGGRVTFADTELEFHPSSPEKGVLEKYNATLIALGINRLEKDSGLIP